MDESSPPYDLCYLLAGTYLSKCSSVLAKQNLTIVRDPAPSTSVPTSITTTFTQYPIVEAVLPHLNNYDLWSLRASCKALRDILPKKSRLLGGTCQSTKVTYWTNRCKSPQYDGPLGRCPGYDEEVDESLESEGAGSTSNNSPQERQTTKIHQTPFWSCKSCVEYAAATCINIIGRDLDAYQIGDSQHMGRFVPICIDCFASLRIEGRGALLRSTLKHASSKLKDCRCIATFKAEAISKNYCLNCAMEGFMREVKGDIDRQIGHYKLLAAKKEGPGFLCGKCEETIPIPKELGRPRLYMCVGCEEIANPSLPCP